MTPARIELDYVRQRRGVPLSGLLMITIGLIAAGWAFSDFRDSNSSVEMHDMTISRYENRRSKTTAETPVINFEELATATRQLTTPWSRLLHDLELAVQDSEKNIALLEIAPDKNKQSVRVSGEARTLTHVLDYVRRLQDAQSIRFPLLETHEIQTSDRDRPVRFVVLAKWRIEG